MYELKPLTAAGIPAALEKAMRYRLLNEPVEAESICLDVLAVDAENQDALMTLLLSLTDQFDQHLRASFRQARDLLPRLDGEYRRLYYDGIICERRAKVHLQRGGPGSSHVTYDWFRQAMDRFDRAAAISPDGNDDAILRWNTCARLMTRHPDLGPEPERTSPQFLE